MEENQELIIEGVEEPQLTIWENGKTFVQTDKKQPRFADLFAGCGGLSLGLTQAGFSCEFVNEIDKTCVETHQNNHNIGDERYFLGDINQLLLRLDNYTPYITDLDLVCGGPPCQGFSMANRQRVLDDPRNQPYKAYLIL